MASWQHLFYSLHLSPHAIFSPACISQVSHAVSKLHQLIEPGSPLFRLMNDCIIKVPNLFDLFVHGDGGRESCHYRHYQTRV